MPFTNNWDVTFPADSQLANQLGLDLRNFRLDTQQRMAAISGLDAAKPNFAGDVQPANWVGILFFATDTGHIYQFQNPAWADVTANFTTQSSALKAVNQVVHTGDTTTDTIYTISLAGNLLTFPSGRLRITVSFFATVISATLTLTVLYGGSQIASVILPTTMVNQPAKYVIEGGNYGTVDLQRWDSMCFVGGISPGIFGNFNVISNVNNTLAQNIVLQAKNGAGAPSDSQTFDYMTVEIY
jgi:hypothetical protein